MKKGLLLLSVFAVWSGCSLVQREPDLRTLSALEFAAATSVSIATLKGTSKAPGAFHGYQRVTNWHAADAEAGSAIAALLAETVRVDLAQARQPGERVSLHSFCFNPGYAVRLQSERGPREFLVCLECDEMYVFDDDGHMWNHPLEKAEAARLATLLGE